MRWTTRELRQFKQILQATSAPLSSDSIESFSRAVFEPVLSLANGHGGQLYIVGSLFLRFLAATLLWLDRKVPATGAVPRNSRITTVLLVLVLFLFAVIGAREVIEAL